MPSKSQLLSLVSVLVVHLIQETSAQAHTFNWGFNVNLTGTQFQECQTLPIILLSLDDNPEHIGIPPYYMIAFEVGGVPTTTSLGSDPLNLIWQNTHKQGSNLMMTVFDSNTTSGGGMGGIDTPMYAVTAGSDTSCLPPAPNQSEIATIVSNVTDTLTTCEVWGLMITGGQKPYTIVLSALNAPITTNITMGKNDSYLTYPNRADPNGQLMASVVDANGNWGISSSVVHTTGSTDVACRGLLPHSSANNESDSSQGTSTQPSPQGSKTPSAGDAKSQSKRNMEVGIAIGVTIVVLIGVGLAIYFCIGRRGPRHDQGTWDAPEPAPYGSYSSGMRDADTLYAGGSASSAFKRSRYDSPGDTTSSMPFMQDAPVAPVYMDEQRLPFASSSMTGSSSEMDVSSSSRTHDPELAAHYRKTREALQERRRAGSSSGFGSSTASMSSPLVDISTGMPAQHGIVLQHVDGGAGPGTMQELPPPYVDRSS